MASLDFPSNPTDQQTYTLNGITYQYNAAIGAWLTVVVGSQPVTLANDTQVLYSNNGLISGSSGLVFDNSANTLYANTINVSSNMRVYGNLQVGTGTVTITNDSISAASIEASNFKFNSGYGSSVIAYGVRAWVNFNGTGTVGVNATIRGSGNVTSVSKPATGLYRVNFTTAMPDANYTAVATSQPNGYSGAYPGTGTNAAGTQSTTYVPIEIRDTNNVTGNSDWIQLLVVR